METNEKTTRYIVGTIKGVIVGVLESSDSANELANSLLSNGEKAVIVATDKPYIDERLFNECLKKGGML